METIDLSRFFTTKAQATDFLMRLNAVMQQIYQTDFNLEKVLLENFGIQKKEIFMGLMRDNKINIDNASTVKEFFEKIQKSISDLPVLTITIAFEPNEHTLQSLSEWFLINLKKQIVLDIAVDHKLIAGTIISYNGKYLDLTIKSIFDQIYSTVVHHKEEKPAEGIQQISPPITHQHPENIHMGR